MTQLCGEQKIIDDRKSFNHFSLGESKWNFVMGGGRGCGLHTLKSKTTLQLYPCFLLSLCSWDILVASIPASAEVCWQPSLNLMNNQQLALVNISNKKILSSQRCFLHNSLYLILFHFFTGIPNSFFSISSCSLCRSICFLSTPILFSSSLILSSFFVDFSFPHSFLQLCSSLSRLVHLFFIFSLFLLFTSHFSPAFFFFMLLVSISSFLLASVLLPRLFCLRICRC